MIVTGPDAPVHDDDSAVHVLQWAEHVSRRGLLDSCAVVLWRRRMLLELTSGSLLAYPDSVSEPVVPRTLCLWHPSAYLGQQLACSLGCREPSHVFVQPQQLVAPWITLRPAQSFGHDMAPPESQTGALSPFCFSETDEDDGDDGNSNDGGTKGPGRSDDPSFATAANVTDVNGLPAAELPSSESVTTTPACSVAAKPSTELSQLTVDSVAGASAMPNIRLVAPSEATTAASAADERSQNGAHTQLQEMASCLPLATTAPSYLPASHPATYSAAAFTTPAVAVPKMTICSSSSLDPVDTHSDRTAATGTASARGSVAAQRSSHVALAKRKQQQASHAARESAHHDHALRIKKAKASGGQGPEIQSASFNQATPSSFGTGGTSLGSGSTATSGTNPAILGNITVEPATAPAPPELIPSALEPTMSSAGCAVSANQAVQQPGNAVHNGEGSLVRSSVSDVDGDNSYSEAEADSVPQSATDTLSAEEANWIFSDMHRWLNDNLYRLAKEHGETTGEEMTDCVRHVMGTTLQAYMCKQDLRLATDSGLLQTLWRAVLSTYVEHQLQLDDAARPCALQEPAGQTGADFAHSRVSVSALSANYRSHTMEDAAMARGSSAAECFISLAGDPHRDVASECDVAFLSLTVDATKLLTCGLLPLSATFTTPMNQAAAPHLQFKESAVADGDVYVGVVTDVDNTALHCYISPAHATVGRLAHWIESVYYAGDVAADASRAVSAFKLNPVGFLLESIRSSGLHTVPGVGLLPVLDDAGALDSTTRGVWKTTPSAVAPVQPIADQDEGAASERFDVAVADLVRLLLLVGPVADIKLVSFGMKASVLGFKERLRHWQSIRVAHTAVFVTIGNNSIRSTRTRSDGSAVNDMLAVRAVEMPEALAPKWLASQYNAFVTQSMEAATLPGGAPTMAFGSSQLDLSSASTPDCNWMHSFEAAAHSLLGAQSRIPCGTPDVLVKSVKWHSEVTWCFRNLARDHLFEDEAKTLAEGRATQKDASDYLHAAKCMVEKLNLAVAERQRAFPLRMEVTMQISHVDLTPDLLDICVRAARLHNVLCMTGVRLEVREIWAPALGSELLPLLITYGQQRLACAAGSVLLDDELLDAEQSEEMCQILHTVLNAYGEGDWWPGGGVLLEPGSRLALWTLDASSSSYNLFWLKNLGTISAVDKAALVGLLGKLAVLADKIRKYVNSALRNAGRPCFSSIRHFWTDCILAVLGDMLRNMKVVHRSYTCTGTKLLHGMMHDGSRIGSKETQCVVSLLIRVLSTQFGGGGFATDADAKELACNLFSRLNAWRNGPQRVKTSHDKPSKDYKPCRRGEKLALYLANVKFAEASRKAAMDVFEQTIKDYETVKEQALQQGKHRNQTAVAAEAATTTTLDAACGVRGKDAAEDEDHNVAAETPASS